MESFTGKIAVVTGGASGMGRELVRQLAAEGCDVAMCDLSVEEMEETKRLALADAPDGTVITTHVCDVSDEQSLIAFRDAVVAQHRTDHVNLLFNNAGIGGGGSVITDTAGGLGTDVQRVLGRRLLRCPDVHAAADRVRRGPHREHLERQRLLGEHRDRIVRTRPTRRRSSP